MSSLTGEEDQKWVPTHVQVTVLRGRGLRGKGKHGTSDVYTIIQLGKEKYSTCVAEKTTEPEWKEECTFDLQPGVLESGSPAGSNELVLTVMHRALIGLDVFLGQALIQLDKVFQESRCVKNEWYRLNSKTGKKEKERGDIQVTIQFTRNNLTASMYDLVMKDKGASTFGKLKERMRGKRRSNDEDSSTGVLPGGYGSLCRMRQRLPSDGGGEEDYEDDEGGEVRRSKMRTFFLRGKLRKSSDTRSSTSLGSESSESSSRGGSLSPTAGISVVVSDLSNSPSNSSNLTADNSPEHTGETSPKSSSSLKCEFGDDTGEITIAVPQRIVCVNGSHAYNVPPLDPGSGKPPSSLGPGLLQKSLPLSMSLQNLSPRTNVPQGPVGDGRRWSFDKPDEEEKAAIVAALEQSGPMSVEGEEENLGPILLKAVSPTVEWDIQGKKQRKNLFSQGRSESTGKGQSQPKDESERVHAAAEEKPRGWFGSKDSHSKPSLVVSPKLEPCTYPHQPLFPLSRHPTSPPIEPASPVSPLHHSNPFCHSQSTSPPTPPSNPFFSFLQHNPFYEDMLMAPQLKPLLPPLPYLSSSRPPIDNLFPQTSNTNPTHTCENPTAEHSVAGTDSNKEPMARVENQPLPPTPTEGATTLFKRSSNPFVRPVEPDLNSEWDESFEAFAAGRLQSPEELTPVCKTPQNVHPLILYCNKEAAPPIADVGPNTSGNDASYHQAATECGFKAHKVTSQATNANAYHFDSFTQFLETIPEHASFESDNITSNTPTKSQNLAAYANTNNANSATNTNDLTQINMHQPLGHTSSGKYDTSSSDPGSSGLGSSAEEDILSCVSSYSDKFSASSSEEAEVQNFDIRHFDNSSELAVVKKSSECEDDIDTSNDLSLDLLDQNTVIHHRDGDEKVDIGISEGSSALQASIVTNSEQTIITGETQAAKTNICLQSEDENEKKTGDLIITSDVLSKVVEDSAKCPSDTTDLMTTTTLDDDLCCVVPSLHIITSSPNASQSLLDLPIEGLGGQDASRQSPIQFEALDFLSTSHIANSASQGFDSALLHTQVSNQSSSSCLQSFYLSVDSQDYQTCESQPSSMCSGGSEPNKTSHSVNSTLCGELSKIRQNAAGAALGQECQPSNEEINCTDQLEEFLCKGEDSTAPLEPSFMIGPDFGLEVLPIASAKHVLCDEFLKYPQTESSMLQRSQSEGNLTPNIDEVLLPSFGSDPGAIQEDLPSPQPSPDHPSLTSLTPSLTPEISSSPVALHSLPPVADAVARSPPSKAGAAMPQPMPQESQHEQRASNQQSSPHPVKPLTTATLAEEKRTEGRSVLEKLKSTIHPGRGSVGEQDADRKKCVVEGAGSYYHLNHSELVALLVQREVELEKQKEEFEQQKCLLAKREVELKRLKPQIKDLEDYIDTLLVRIMEQKPTLLQVRSKLK
ncbi:uncharacterized protein rab11fip5a isoform X1 [Antennarius striatus]|uniref:uncharacterized protein rab11fip5a isoform X1 n=1 Tax=Antennarius striatus TaxID=241820 RepID=UPI0035B0DD84